VVVDDFYSGIHYSAVVLVYSASEVDVFWIHEKTRVEETDLSKGFAA
jgi:hypothetical protein